MRVAVVDTYYAAFVASFYERRPELRDASYADQHAALIAESFGTSDAYSHHLNALGHEAIDLIADCEQLQYRWADEHGVLATLRRGAPIVPGRAGPLIRRRVLRAITLRQIDEFRPDVVFCHNLAFFSRRELDKLRRSHLVVGRSPHRCRRIGSSPAST